MTFLCAPLRFAALPFALTGLLATAAAAVCLDGVGAPLPVKVTFDSGGVVEVLDRSTESLRYRFTPPDNSPAMELTMQAGLFTVLAVRDKAAVTFDWTTGLPAFAEVVVGASFEEMAEKTAPGTDPSAFVTKAQVTGAEVISLGGCDYPVLVIEVQNFDAGRDVGQVTKYLHLPSQITLKSVVRQGGSVRENTAVMLE